MMQVYEVVSIWSEHCPYMIKVFWKNATDDYSVKWYWVNEMSLSCSAFSGAAFNPFIISGYMFSPENVSRGFLTFSGEIEMEPSREMSEQ